MGTERPVMPRPEWWTTDQIAEYLNIKPSSVKGWCSTWKVRRVLMARADDVRKARARQVGQGARTDLKRQEGDRPPEY